MGSFSSSLRMILTATMRSRTMSHARYTLPWPPEATLLRNSNCRSCIGIMIACPHLVQGTEASGGKSPGINTLASQPGQVTIFSGFSLSLMALRSPLFCSRPDYQSSVPGGGRLQQLYFLCNAFSPLGQRTFAGKAPVLHRYQTGSVPLESALTCRRHSEGVIPNRRLN